MIMVCTGIGKRVYSKQLRRTCAEDIVVGGGGLGAMTHNSIDSERFFNGAFAPIPFLKTNRRPFLPSDFTEKSSSTFVSLPSICYPGCGAQ